MSNSSFGPGSIFSRVPSEITELLSLSSEKDLSPSDNKMQNIAQNYCLVFKKGEDLNTISIKKKSLIRMLWQKFLKNFTPYKADRDLNESVALKLLNELDNSNTTSVAKKNILKALIPKKIKDDYLTSKIEKLSDEGFQGLLKKELQETERGLIVHDVESYSIIDKDSKISLEPKYVNEMYQLAKSFEEKTDLVNKAANNEDIAAKLEFKAVFWLRHAAESGHSQAYLDLAEKYSSGFFEMSKDSGGVSIFNLSTKKTIDCIIRYNELQPEHSITSKLVEVADKLIKNAENKTPLSPESALTSIAPALVLYKKAIGLGSTDVKEKYDTLQKKSVLETLPKWENDGTYCIISKDPGECEPEIYIEMALLLKDEKASKAALDSLKTNLFLNSYSNHDYITEYEADKILMYLTRLCSSYQGEKPSALEILYATCLYYLNSELFGDDSEIRLNLKKLRLENPITVKKIKDIVEKANAYGIQVSEMALTAIKDSKNLDLLFKSDLFKQVFNGDKEVIQIINDSLAKIQDEESRSRLFQKIFENNYTLEQVKKIFS